MSKPDHPPIDGAFKPAKEAPSYRFGDFELSTRPLRLMRLSADGEPSGEGHVEVPLQPQPARALELLAERAGELVTRTELRERLWGLEAHLDHEQAINFTIRRVRSALSDSAQSPRYVETLPRQGYRLVAPVERRPLPSQPADDTPIEDIRGEPPKTRFPAVGWSIAALVAVVVSVVWAIERPPSPTQLTPGHAIGEQGRLSEQAKEDLWRARVLIDRGDATSLSEAKTRLETLVVAAPDSPEVALAMAEWWMADSRLGGALGKRFDAYWPEVERWAERARSLDPSNLDAQVLVANARFYLHNDRRGARQLLTDNVLDRDAEHAKAVHLNGLILASLGDFDLAITAIRRAVSLDPENLWIGSDLALVYLLAGRWDDAIRQARQIIEMDMSHGWWLMLEAQDLAGREQQAEATAIEIARTLYGVEIDGLTTLRQLSYEALVRQTADGDPRLPALARWAVQFGQEDQAIDALLAACDGPGDWDRPFIAVHPRFAELRTHSRWGELAACVD